MKVGEKPDEATNIQFYLLNQPDANIDTRPVRRISHGEVFDSMYGGLEEVIRHNNFTKRKLGTRIETPYWKEERAEEEESLMREWYAGVPEIAAKVPDKNGGSQIMRVRVREDLEFTNHPNPERRGLRIRQPNIVFLEGDDSTLIFREARTYPPNTRKQIGKSMGRTTDMHWLHSFDKPDGGEIRRNILDRQSRKPRAYILPEPFLHAALEAIYSESDLPRITPHVRYVGVNEERSSLFSIRPFLHPAAENPVTELTVAQYIGTLQGLGIRASEDRQRAHYCWQPALSERGSRVLIDIDPDQYFALHNNPQEMNRDKEDFIRNMGNIAPMIAKSESVETEIQRAKQRATPYAARLLHHIPSDIQEVGAQLIQQTYREQLL